MRLIALLRPCRQLSLHLTSSPRPSPCRIVFLLLASSSSSSFNPFYPLFPLVISLALRLVVRAISALGKWPLHTSPFWTGPPARCGTQRQSVDTENVCRYEGDKGRRLRSLATLVHCNRSQERHVFVLLCVRGSALLVVSCVVYQSTVPVIYTFCTSAFSVW